MNLIIEFLIDIYKAAYTTALVLVGGAVLILRYAVLGLREVLSALSSFLRFLSRHLQNKGVAHDR